MFAARRRHFVVHSAHKTVGVSLASLDLEAGRETFGEELCPAEQPTLRVCLVTGPGDDQATFSAEILTEYLRSVRAGPWDPICCRTSDDWADLGDLAACHCAVLFLDRQLPAEWLAVAADRAQAGGGLIGLRAAHGPWLCPATRGSVLFGAECLGRHINSSKPAVRIAPAAALHPTVAGVRPFVAAGDLAVVRTLPRPSSSARLWTAMRRWPGFAVAGLAGVFALLWGIRPIFGKGAFCVCWPMRSPGPAKATCAGNMPVFCPILAEQEPGILDSEISQLAVYRGRKPCLAESSLDLVLE